MSNFDWTTDYNNGVPPAQGLVWNGESWGWQTRGIISSSGGEETMTVWPSYDVGDWGFFETDFDPSTGDGWVPSVDGMTFAIPQATRPETLSAIQKVQAKMTSSQPDLISADFWSLVPFPEYPDMDNSYNPFVTLAPAQLMTDTDLSSLAAAPETVKVHTRLLDDVHDGVQHFSAVASRNQQFEIPVIQAEARSNNNWYLGRMPGGLGFLEFYVESNDSPAVAEIPYAGNPLYISVSESAPRSPGFTVGVNSNDCVIWFPAGSGRAPLYATVTTVMPASYLQSRQQAEATAQENAMNDAISFNQTFFESLSEKGGALVAQSAKELAANVKGKTIRSVDEAVAAFNKYQDTLTKKYSVADRTAIATGLEAVTQQNIGASMIRFSKVLGIAGYTLDVYGVATDDLPNAIKSGDWRSFFVSMESLIAGYDAVALAAFTFSALAGTASGVLEYALIVALVGAMVDDDLIVKMNSLLGL